MRRVMLKVSGESLKGKKSFGFDDEVVDKMLEEVADSASANIELCLLVGGGNLLRGQDLSEIDKYKADEIGMLSTVINGIFVSEKLRQKGIKNLIYGSFPITDIVRLFDKNEINEKLKEGYVILLTGGTGHPYFTTDSGVVLRGVELDCDEILLAKSVDGVYDSDPEINKNAKKFDKITYDEIVLKNLQVVDMTSAIMAKENKKTLRIFAMKEKDSIKKAIHGENIGTIVTV